MTKIRELLIHKSHFSHFVFSCMLGAAISLLMTVGSGMLLGLVESEENRISDILILGVAYVVLPSFLMKLTLWIEIPFEKRFRERIRSLLVNRIFAMRYEEFRKKNRSEYLSLLIHDVSNFEGIFIKAVKEFINSIITVLLSLLLLFVIDGKAFLISLLYTLLVIVTSMYFMRRIEQLIPRINQENLNLTNKLENMVEGFADIKICKAEQSFLNRFYQAVEDSDKKIERYHFYTSCQDILSNQMGTVISLLILILVSNEMAAGSMSLGTAVLVVFVIQMCVQNVGALFTNRNTIHSSAKFISKWLEEDIPKLQELPDERIKHTEKKLLSYKLELNKITFSYEERKLFNELSFSIEAGEKILIKGESGCGKSTLLSLLCGDLSDYDGQVLYDGVPMEDVDRGLLNQRCAVIYQDVFLFDDTLRNNITLYNDYSEEALRQAIHLAGLDEVVRSLSEGVDTVLKENGKVLSGGERQRLSIARAIIKQPDIIFADEPTASLPENLSVQIEKTLLSLPQTVLLVSHKEIEANRDLIDKELSFYKGGKACLS